MFRWRTALTLLGIGTLLVTSMTQSALAEDEGNDSIATSQVLAETSHVKVLEDGVWIRHEYTRSLPGAETTVLTGKRIESRSGNRGCNYSGADTEQPGEITRGQIRISREIGHNLNSCLLEIETAVVGEGEASDLGLLASDTSGMQTVVESSPDAGLTTNATTIGRYQKIYYEDPIQIDVTSITAKVRWTYTGTCTTWSSHEAAWGWYSPSGWSRTASWYGFDYASCAWGATTSNTGTYQNTWFCDALTGSDMPDTWNRYDTNYVQGKSNGTVYYEWSANKWGGCANLLSFHRAIGDWNG